MKKLWGCSVFDGMENGFLPYACVELAEEKISRVEVLPENAVWDNGNESIDLRGCTVLPGLIECEGHLGLDGLPGSTVRMANGSAVDSFVNCVKSAERFLSRGVTTVRDLGDKACETLKLRDEVRAGKFKGPRIIGAGMPIKATHGHFVGYEVDGVDEARNAVRKVLHNGADLVKVISSSSKVLKHKFEVGTPELLIDEMKIVCDIAHSCGKKVASHAHCSEAVYNSIVAGVDTIEHGTALTDEIIEMMLERGVWLVPTFTAYDMMAKEGKGNIPDTMVAFAQRVLDVKYPWFKKAMKSGVKIACGTDAGSPMNLHGNIGRELRCMMEMGMSAAKALVTCTSAAAEVLDMADEIGSIKAGYLADAVVIEGNPLEDIEAIERVKMVFQNGKLVFADGRLM